MARESISGFRLTAANYQQAVALFKKSKQKIVDKHLEALFNVDPVTGGNNIRSLQCLFDAVTFHMGSLQALEVQPATYASTFCPRLLNKIPNDLTPEPLQMTDGILIHC